MAEQTQTKKKSSAGSVIVTIILVIAILFAIVCSYSAFTTKSGSGVPSIFGFEPKHHLYDYWQFSRPLPYQIRLKCSHYILTL